MPLSRPPTIEVLCIDHLHKFTAPEDSEYLSCPYCGCKYVRLVQNNTTAYARVEIDKVYTEISPPSWLEKLGGENA